MLHISGATWYRFSMSGDKALVGSTKRWLLLIHQLPPKPAYFRVKIWRRLHTIGAVAIKNAVYALPCSAETQEDFEWLLREIEEGGGEAMLCEVRLLDGLSDEQAQALFVAARDGDYDEIAKDARALTAVLQAEPEKRAEARDQLSRLRKRFSTAVAIDFFGANSREAAEGLLSVLENQIREENQLPERTKPSPISGTDLKKRVWVTRRDVHVDRIACAWLIRRFIDPDGRFKFVPGTGYQPEEGELRFDMFEAEFTHEGDRCSYEVLLAHAGTEDPALQAIADIVHDIDLKDEKFGREEVSGIKALIAGICMATSDDGERVERGSAMLDELYSYFQKKRG